MTGEEYRDLAALWSAPPEPAEQRELERIARRTPRVARAVQYAELVLGIALAILIVGTMMWRLGLATLLTGSLILLLLAWSSRKRHRLANLAALVDSRDRLSFVGSVVRAKEAELSRSAIGLALMVPGTLLAALLGFLLQVDAPGESFATFIPDAIGSARAIVSLSFLLAGIVLLSLSHLRLVAELERLRELRDDYVDEVRRDARDTA